MITKEVIQKIIFSHNSNLHGSLSEYIADEMDKWCRINKDRRWLQGEKDKLEKWIEERKQSIREMEYALMAKCRHWDVTFHRDASGGNDSEYMCNDCGFQDRTIDQGRILEKENEK